MESQDKNSQNTQLFPFIDNHVRATTGSDYETIFGISKSAKNGIISQSTSLSTQQNSFISPPQQPSSPFDNINTIDNTQFVDNSMMLQDNNTNTQPDSNEFRKEEKTEKDKAVDEYLSDIVVMPRMVSRIGKGKRRKVQRLFSPHKMETRSESKKSEYTPSFKIRKNNKMLPTGKLQSSSLIVEIFNKFTIQEFYSTTKLEELLLNKPKNLLLEEGKRLGLQVRNAYGILPLVYVLARYIRENVNSNPMKQLEWKDAIPMDEQISKELLNAYFSKDELDNSLFVQRSGPQSSWQTLIWTRFNFIKVLSFLHIINITNPVPFPFPLYAQMKTDDYIERDTMNYLDYLRLVGEKPLVGRICQVVKKGTKFMSYKYGVICGPNKVYASYNSGRKVPVAILEYTKYSHVFNEESALPELLNSGSERVKLDDEFLRILNTGVAVDANQIKVYVSDTFDIPPMILDKQQNMFVRAIAKYGSPEKLWLGIIFNSIVNEYQKIFKVPSPPIRVYIAASLIIHPTFPTLLTIQPHNIHILEKYGVATSIRQFIEPLFISRTTDKTYTITLMKSLEVWQNSSWVSNNWHRVAAESIQSFLWSELNLS